MAREKATDKILVLGVDGLEPSLTKKFMDQGKLPNFKKFVERGACREDLVLLGAMPTITPPLWTTLATGAYPETHGITCFWRQSPDSLDEIVYAFDSIGCKAEQLWNIFAEAGKKTLVWHWPGGSWPPSSNNENLMVVDGTQPAHVSMGVALRDMEKHILASVDIEVEEVAEGESHDNGAGCIITDLGDTANQAPIDASSTKALEALDKALNRKKVTAVMTTLDEGDFGTKLSDTTTREPLKPAKNWPNAKEGSKEFSITLASGARRWVCLLEPNDKGVFETVAIYKNKKADAPLAVVHNNELVKNVLDDLPYKDGTTTVNRTVRVFNLAEDGSSVEMWVSNGLDINEDGLFHPKSIYQDVIKNVDYVQPVMVTLGGRENIVRNIMLPSWEVYTEWQAKCLQYFIDQKGVEIVFSHLHNVDNMAHVFWNWSVERDYQPGLNTDAYIQFIEEAYVDTDRYLGRFMHYLDEGWTIFVVSDHGLLVTEELPPVLGDPFGVNAGVMCELGYTALKEDENGKKAIDWTKTRALATRGNHIWINLKGRNPNGIVDPADKYELEREIISDLYNYREPKHNRRIVSLALRNKDAAVLGMSGPECGDILYWLEEGYNRVHGDSLSTFKGCVDTSVSPIFIAAGKGIKPGYTKRVIRQVDVAATIAVLGGVRMPAQCEGAPVYQILEQEF